jgi:hypothetical protein
MGLMPERLKNLWSGNPRSTPAFLCKNSPKSEAGSGLTVMLTHQRISGGGLTEFLWNLFMQGKGDGEKPVGVALVLSLREKYGGVDGKRGLERVLKRHDRDAVGLRIVLKITQIILNTLKY